MEDSIELVVVHRRYLTPEICQFDLRDPNGGTLPRFTAGSHIKVVTRSGDVRSYSLNNDEIEDHRYVVSVKREEHGRGGSLGMHRDIREGDTIMVSAPKNDLPLVPGSRYLLIAGGIGITPLLSMFRKLSREGHEQVTLIYSTRTSEDAAYLDELSNGPFARNVILHHSHVGDNGNFDFWPYLRTPQDMHIYYCGPKPMMDAIYNQTIHWPRRLVHYEDFAGVSGVATGSAAFNVRRVSTGEIVEIPSDQTIVETFRARGLKPASSCESGTCGTCRVRLISGEPDHRDLCLTEEERKDYFIPCVSRAVGNEICLDM